MVFTGVVGHLFAAKLLLHFHFYLSLINFGLLVHCLYDQCIVFNLQVWKINEWYVVIDGLAAGHDLLKYGVVVSPAAVLRLSQSSIGKVPDDNQREMHVVHLTLQILIIFSDCSIFHNFKCSLE